MPPDVHLTGKEFRCFAMFLVSFTVGFEHLLRNLQQFQNPSKHLTTGFENGIKHHFWKGYNNFEMFTFATFQRITEKNVGWKGPPDSLLQPPTQREEG